MTLGVSPRTAMYCNPPTCCSYRGSQLRKSHLVRRQRSDERGELVLGEETDQRGGGLWRSYKHDTRTPPCKTRYIHRRGGLLRTPFPARCIIHTPCVSHREETPKDCTCEELLCRASAAISHLAASSSSWACVHTRPSITHVCAYDVSYRKCLRMQTPLSR